MNTDGHRSVSIRVHRWFHFAKDSGFSDLDALDTDAWLARPARVARRYRQQHIQALGHFAKDRMLPIQPGCRNMGNKELGAIRVRSGIGHAQYSWAVVTQLRMKFVGKLVPGSPRACPRGVSTLSHEVGDNPVKGHTVIESLPGKEYKIVHCSRNSIRVETNNNIPDIGLQG